MSEKMSKLFIERNGEQIYLTAKEAEQVYRAIDADYKSEDLFSKYKEMEEDKFEWFIDPTDAALLKGKAKEAFMKALEEDFPGAAEGIDHRLGKIDGYWDYYWQVVEDIVTELVEDAFAGVADNLFWICTDIEWDTDGEDPEELGLPKMAVFEYNDLAADAELADLLSDKYGYCVNGLSFILGFKEDIPEGGAISG